MSKVVNVLSSALSILSLSTSLYSCTSTPTVTTYKPEVTVLEASDKKPSWVNITKSSGQDDEGLFFVSFITLDGNSSKSAALNMSDEKAFSEAFRSIVDEFLDQNQVGEDVKNSIGHRIISATNGYRPMMPTLHISSRYWETVFITLPDGSFRSELRAWSKASLSGSDFEKAKLQYENRLRAIPQIQTILDDIGASQRASLLTK